MSSLNFAVSAELEVVFAKPSSEEEWLCRSGNSLPINPHLALARPTDLTLAQQEMEQSYARLTPTNAQERETQERWLEYVRSNIAPSDYINFRLYTALARPTLHYIRYPIGSTYTQVTGEAGQIEYRGPGIYQTGWYDNPGISEVRIAPTPLNKFPANRASTLTAIANIAAREGHRAFLASQHTNISAFIGNRPVFGEPRQNLTPYRASAAGLRTLFLEGALLDPDRYPNTRSRLSMGPWRTNDVRMPPGRIEFRVNSPRLGEYNNGLRFLVAGIHYGLQHSSAEEQNEIFTSSALQVTADEHYDKNKDLYILRALESCCFDDGGNLQMASDQGNADKALSALLGRTSSVSFSFYNCFFTKALRLGDDGYMQTDAALIKTLLDIPFVANGRDRTILDIADIPAINAKLRHFKVKPTEVVLHYIRNNKPRAILAKLRAAKAFPLVSPDEYAMLVSNCEGLYENESIA